MDRPDFASVQEYGARFSDVAYWRPYVEEVCRSHGLNHTNDVRSGLPGTHPVFMVGGRYVVKFFSDLFGGEHSFSVERECYRVLLQAPEIPTARLLAEGSLFRSDDGWSWPYLISTLLPGVSLSESDDQIGQEERERIARDLGRWLKRLHHLPLDAASALLANWTPFIDWLTAQRAGCIQNHRQWRSLPEHLIVQLDGYLPEVDTLVNLSAAPLLLHCDMNADHLLGRFIDGRWTTSGIIDFGDARVGDFHYELVALCLGLFRADMRLLRRFLSEYGSDADQQPDFAARAMAYTLLHECNVLESIGEFVPELQQIQTLEELARRIWT